MFSIQTSIHKNVLFGKDLMWHNFCFSLKFHIPYYTNLHLSAGQICDAFQQKHNSQRQIYLQPLPY